MRRRAFFAPISGRTPILAVVLCAAVLGCLRADHAPRVYERDGETYGVTQGRFRGRWWNYYERGCSFSAGRFWSEAEADLRKAMAGRGRDGLWARTYGLHFIQEYFPQRELGVVRFQQGNAEEAVALLERSLADTHSARAAYYLEQARRHIVQRDRLDAAPPSFEATAPVGAQAAPGYEIALEGVARDDTYVARIFVAGQSLPVNVCAPSVTVTHRVALTPGVNEIPVVVEDIVGNRSQQEVVIRADVDGPAVSFDAPIALPGRVSGVAMDASGVAALNIGGQEAALEQTDDGLAVFETVLDLDRPRAPIRFVCRDCLGNLTTGTLPVDAVAVAHAGEAAVFASAAQRWSGFAGGRDLHGIAADGFMVLAALPAPAAGPVVRIHNPEPGSKCRREEVAVELELESGAQLAAATLNGSPVPLIPGRTRQRRCRRVALDHVGRHTLVAEVRDVQGSTARDTVHVERELNNVEEVARLDAALVGCDWEMGASSLGDAGDLRAVVLDWLHTELYEARRFTHLLERSPEEMGAVVSEQQLSAALGSKDEVLAIQQVVPAELLLIAKARRYEDCTEIILTARSTERFGAADVLTVARADVCGPAEDMGQLRELVEALALRFLSELPRVEGLVARVSGDSVTTTLGQFEHGVRPNLKLVLYRQGEPIVHPGTGEVLDGGEPEVIGEALVQTVREKTSKAAIVRKFVDEPIEVGCGVVTK